MENINTSKILLKVCILPIYPFVSQFYTFFALDGIRHHFDLLQQAQMSLQEDLQVQQEILYFLF